MSNAPLLPFAHTVSKGGLVVPGDSTTNAHRDLIVSLAAEHRLPAVYSNEFFVTALGQRVWAGNVLCGPYSPRRQACRPCSAGCDQVCNSSQRQDGEVTRLSCATRLAHCCRSSDRVVAPAASWCDPAG